jgi:hypothetical protein
MNCGPRILGQHMPPPIPNQPLPLVNLVYQPGLSTQTPLYSHPHPSPPMAMPTTSTYGPPLSGPNYGPYPSSSKPPPAVSSASATSYAPSMTQPQYLPPLSGAIMRLPSAAPKTTEVTRLTI